MLDYEDYRELFLNTSDQEKLSMLQTKAKSLLGPLISQAALIVNLIEKYGTPNMPDDFLNWSLTVFNSAQELAGLVEASLLAEYPVDDQPPVSVTSDSENLNTLRPEAKRLLDPMIGYATLTTLFIEERGAPTLPDNFPDDCQKVLNLAKELYDLFEATLQRHRTEAKQEAAASNRELGEKLWADDQRDLPELQPYLSLEDALKQIAQTYELNLFEPTSAIRVDASFLAPAGIVHCFVREHHARAGIQRGGRGNKPLGYGMTLLWLTDPRNMTFEEQSYLAPSLKEVVFVLQQWLMEGRSLAQLMEHHPWITPSSTQ